MIYETMYVKHFSQVTLHGKYFITDLPMTAEPKTSFQTLSVIDLLYMIMV